MKKFVYVSTLFGIVALVVLLVVGSAAAGGFAQAGPGEGEIEPEVEIEPGGEREPEPGGGFSGGEGEPELGGSGPRGAGPSLQEAGADPEEPSGTAVRIDFEVSGHKARRGLYVLQQVGGDALASWYAMDGWTDSGWFEDFDIAHETIHVQVLYYPGPNTNPTVMRILNRAPGTSYGWMSQGVAHAIEVAWPDMPIADSDL